MKFLKYLKEYEKMSDERAFSILGINPKDYDKKNLRKYYKNASLRSHPDRGGDTETMKLINLAYEKLKNLKDYIYKGLSVGSDKKRLSKKVDTIVLILKNSFNAKNYKKYLEKISGLKLKYKEKEMIQLRTSGYIKLFFEFFTPDKNTIFRSNINVFLSDVNTEVIGDKIKFDYYVRNSVEHNKKQITGLTTSSKHDADEIKNPSKTFPKTELDKIFKE